MRVLELGTYLAPAYAGMVLAEQGHDVLKWHAGNDPIPSLHRGDELWAWVNHRKRVECRHVSRIHDLILDEGWRPDIVVDNFRPQTLQRLGIDPAQLAQRYGIAWVSLRAEVGDTSFDLLAQCRSWMEFAPWMPFYLGDTIAGLWLAFKALSLSSQRVTGHAVIGHASCLQKMVEGELVVDIERDGVTIPWDVDEYVFREGRARIAYRGRIYHETPRDRDWKRANLWHDGTGRIII